MTVAELIAFLQTKPQEIQVAYAKFSEACLMRPEQIRIVDGCEPRADGWIQNARPDMETQKYLIFPED